MLAPESKLPILRTVARVYRFIAAHPADLIRIGWLPLLLLLGAGIGLDIASDGDADSASTQFIGKVALASLLQGAIGVIMLVAWHRLVMRDYALAATAAAGPARREIAYFLRVLGLSVLFLIVFLVAFMVAEIVLIGIHWAATGTGQPAGTADPSSAHVLLGFMAVLIGLFPAFYVTLRLSLALPATAVDRDSHFGRSWRASRGNGWRMVMVTVLAMLPVEAINAGIAFAGKPLRDTPWHLPVLAAGSVTMLVLMAVLGTALSICYAALASAATPQSFPLETPVPA